MEGLGAFRSRSWVGEKFLSPLTSSVVVFRSLANFPAVGVSSELPQTDFSGAVSADMSFGGAVVSGQPWVRVNTRLLYQQTKFNLLREESEGYAKLVTLLCEGSGSSSSSSSTIGIIKVLECFEMRPDSRIFLDLIPIFPKSHAAQILGFKFQYYQRMEVQDPVPFRLYQLAALLVKQDFVDLDSMWLVKFRVCPEWSSEVHLRFAGLWVSGSRRPSPSLVVLCFFQSSFVVSLDLCVDGWLRCPWVGDFGLPTDSVTGGEVCGGF
ncbi:hypothetical protein Cgig2_031766 [Carnegiea gigantea]|uniref:THO complex subunit 2 N-terminal domain-containing protein n=1 Tax=Carnegiea gigantea TaxID=171969 RepID=A0A9Q1KQU5_9CARY|nr:hypothetical protein Cgig2_031766 [Carnegiea gigantea]